MTGGLNIHFILIIPQITPGSLKASPGKSLNRKVGLGGASLKICSGSTLSSTAVFIFNFFLNVLNSRVARNRLLLRPARLPGRGRLWAWSNNQVDLPVNWLHIITLAAQICSSSWPGRAWRSCPSQSNFYSGWWKEPRSPEVRGQHADGLWGFWPNPLLLTGFIAWEDELVTLYI